MTRSVLGVAAGVLLAAAGLAGAGDSPAPAPPPGALTVPERLRLLVVAPHPDDEVLGAGGLIQRVRDLGGRVSVANLTSGDGYVDGVELETAKPKPLPRDFVDYGELRIREAVRAMGTIAIPPKRLAFLGFPDSGLAALLSRHWSSKNPYVSPYTGDDRPPYPQSLNPRARYSGVALEREISLLVASLDPDWIAVTAPWDVHPDHCAAFTFVLRALGRLAATDPGIAHVKILAYTVHRPDWPVAPEGHPLRPPPHVDPGAGAWRALELSSEELEGKGRAIEQYASQMDIMAVVFRAFVRSNEMFAFYSKAPVEPPEACARPSLDPTLTAIPASASR